MVTFFLIDFTLLMTKLIFKLNNKLIKAIKNKNLANFL